MKYYLYIHRRPDTGQIFYVGRGMQYKRSTNLRRAFALKGRNKIWHGIVDRNNGEFDVEILLWVDEAEEIQRLEREAIAAFGKIIDGTGPLCNLTDGGEGCEGYSHSEETKAKLKLAHARNPSRAIQFKSKEFRENARLKKKDYPGTMLGKKHSDTAKLAMSFARKGSKHYAARRVINAATGDVYGCVEDAALTININKWILYKSLSGERANKTQMRYENGV